MVIRVLVAATILSRSYGSFKVAKPCWWSTMLLWIPIIPNPAYLRRFCGVWGGLPCRQTTTNHYRNAVNMQNLGRCVFLCRWIECRACFVWCATCVMEIYVQGWNSTCPLARPGQVVFPPDNKITKCCFPSDNLDRGSVARQILVSTLILSGMTILFMKSTKITT